MRHSCRSCGNLALVDGLWQAFIRNTCVVQRVTLTLAGGTIKSLETSQASSPLTLLIVAGLRSLMPR